MRPWTTRELRDALALRANGHGVREIAALLGRSPSHVSRLLRNRGCPPPSEDEVRERQGKAQAERNRSFCAALGWPEVTVPGQARILDALYRLGPLRFGRLASAAGWTVRVGKSKSRNLNKFRRALAALTRPFLVEDRGAKAAQRTRRLVDVLPGASGRTRRYALSAWLLARRETS